MRNLFSIVLIFLSLISLSQIKEGAKVVDLSFSFSDFDSQGNSTFFYVQPLIGFGISENQLLYGGVRYESLKQEFTSISEESIVSFVLAYEKFFELNAKVYFAPILSGSYGFGKGDTPADENDINSFSIGISPRLHYFINNKWSVVASIGAISFSREVQKSDGGDFTTKALGASLNASNVNFGLRLNLNNE